jgi:hypothetical protein
MKTYAGLPQMKDKRQKNHRIHRLPPDFSGEETHIPRRHYRRILKISRRGC